MKSMKLSFNANECSAEDLSRTMSSVPSVKVSGTGSELSQTNMNVPDVQLEIRRTFQDIARRKCNVITTNLPESQSTNEDDSKAADVEDFTKLSLLLYVANTQSLCVVLQPLRSSSQYIL